MKTKKTEKKKTFTQRQRSGTHSVMYAISQIHSMGSLLDEYVKKHASEFVIDGEFD